LLVLKVEGKFKILKIECSAGMASDVLFSLSEIPKEVDTTNNNVCTILIDMKYIDKCNTTLNKYKGSVKFDSSFLEWKKKFHKKTPILIRSAVINTKIYRSPDFEVPHQAIEDATKYFFKPAVNMKSYKDKKWDGYVKLYERRFYKFPTGLIDRVLEVFDKEEIPYTLEHVHDESPPKEFDWEPKELFVPSEDQLEAVDICMKYGRGVVKAATGFGKTAMLARYLTASHGVPTLFIANKKILLDDAANDFRNGIEGLLEGDIAQIKDGKFGDINLRKKESFTQYDLDNALSDKKIIVATIQSLHARVEDTKTRGALIHWLHNTCKFVMIDESQAINDKQWQDVLNEVRAPYRIALSATPRRTDGATLLIAAQSGPLIYETTADEQIRKGRLCDLKIDCWPFDHKLYNDNDKELNYAEVYTQCIVENEERNRFLIERTLEMLDEERQVLMLVLRIEHGHILKEMLLEKGLSLDEVNFVWGDTPDKVRTKAVEDFRKGKYKILIGSTVADAGLNIPSISGVILCGAGNSDITHIQRIGRGSRTFDYLKNWGFEPKFIHDANGEKITRIIDPIDINIAFFKKQSKNRYYNACEEFGADRVHLIGVDASIFRYRSKKTESKKDIDDQKALEDMFNAFSGVDNEETEENTMSQNDAVDNFISIFKR